jgi:hypothetical protein
MVWVFSKVVRENLYIIILSSKLVNAKGAVYMRSGA